MTTFDLEIAEDREAQNRIQITFDLGIVDEFDAPNRQRKPPKYAPARPGTNWGGFRSRHERKPPKYSLKRAGAYLGGFRSCRERNLPKYVLQRVGFAVGDMVVDPQVVQRQRVAG